MLNILFIGDIFGKIGRRAVAEILPKIKDEYKIDLVIANAENSAHGSGATPNTLKELTEAGIDFFTNGDHSFRQSKDDDIYKKYHIIRPANFPPGLPGQGCKVIKKDKNNILVINLIGRVFMQMNHDCPFRKINEILADKNLAAKNISAIIVDIHGECTSEKVSLRHYVDGQVSAILGTHTHIKTADHQITKKGTGYITDVGMCGFADGCIGLDKTGIIDTFLTQVKNKHEVPETGRAIFDAVLLEINPKNKKTEKIIPITKFINIK